MPYVFVSYAKRDKEFIDRLTSDLQTAGIELWSGIDSRSPDRDWVAEIAEAIRHAACVLFVSSENTISSPFMAERLHTAIRSAAPVIPIAIDTPGFEHMPVQLRNVPWYDFRGDYATAVERLIDHLPVSVRREPELPHERPSPVQSKGYVFISYAEEDSAFVVKLREFLKARGYGYWDYQDSDRDYHTHLFLELEEVVREAEATLSVLSPDWKKSKWAPKEMIFSEEVGTPVFLLMARDMGPTLVTAGIAHIDFVRDEEKGFERLDRELRRKGLI